MSALTGIWRRVADHTWTHAVLRFLFNCRSYADIEARRVAIRLGTVVTGSTLLCLALSVPFNLKLDWGFREGFPLTMLSVFMLFAIGHFCLKIHHAIGRGVPSTALWKVLAVSFIFLGFDDWLRIHETTDRVIHKIFKIRETEFTDHLDDLLVALYAAAIAAILFRGRRELRQYRSALPFFIPASILAAVHCVLDFVVSSRSWIRGFVPDPIALEATIIWGEVAEECFKLSAEVFIVAASVRCYTVARDRVALVKDNEVLGATSPR